MFGTNAPAIGRRLGLIALAMLLAVLSTSGAQTQAAPAQQAAAAPNPYVFQSDGALLSQYIKPDKTADFEMILAKVKEALMKGPADMTKPESAELARTWPEMAKSWHVYKAQEMGPGMSTIYVSVINPAVKGADYSISNILAAGFPTEANELYKTYAEVFANPPGSLIHIGAFTEMGAP